ncbi:hypothetical protein Tco_1047970, partial [Tanacetum coccineum]
SKLSRFGRSDCDGVLEDRLVGPSMVGFVMEKKDGSNMREDITTRVNLEESGATCDGSPKVSNSSPLVSPTATINMPQGLYNVDVAATFGVPLTIVGDLHILIKCIEAEADIVDVITIGIPSLTGDGFTKETIHVVYEWRPHRCDICKIFGHVHDHCPNKAVSPPIVNTSNVVTPIVEKTNRRKGKATINALKKGATNVGNPSTSSSMLKTTGISSKKYNIPTCNSYFVLNDEQEEEEEDVENMYDETANLFTKTGESSSFTAVVVQDLDLSLYTTDEYDDVEFKFEYKLDESFFITSCFRHLKLQDEDLIHNILSGSPILETLNLTYCYGFKRLDITSKSVKNLVFRGYANYEDEFGNDAYIIEINAPYLLSLAIQKHLFLWKLILLNVSSLVKANLDYEMSEQEAEEEVHKEFILSLRNVKDLIIGDSCEKVFSRLKDDGFTFPSNVIEWEGLLLDHGPEGDGLID